MDPVGCRSLFFVGLHDQRVSHSVAAAKVIKGGKTVRKVDVNEILEGLEEQIKDPTAWAYGDLWGPGVGDEQG